MWQKFIKAKTTKAVVKGEANAENQLGNNCFFKLQKQAANISANDFVGKISSIFTLA